MWEIHTCTNPDLVNGKFITRPVHSYYYPGCERPEATLPSSAPRPLAKQKPQTLTEEQRIVNNEKKRVHQ